MAEKTITVIPARKRVGSRKQVTEEKPKLRVAAYCRVSTDRDEQESSYEAQVEHYTEFIDRNPEWQLAGIYADDGISGTNTKKREEFNRMIEDCMAFFVIPDYQFLELRSFRLTRQAVIPAYFFDIVTLIQFSDVSIIIIR